MAKKKSAGVSKTKLVRNVMSTNPDLSASQVVEEVKTKHGVEVSAALVYQAKADAKKAGKGTVAAPRKKPGRKPGRKPGMASTNGQVTGNGFAAIQHAVQFIKAAGGIEAAKQALATIEEIRSL
jgi:hypothetical protein